MPVVHVLHGTVYKVTSVLLDNILLTSNYGVQKLLVVGNQSIIQFGFPFQKNTFFNLPINWPSETLDPLSTKHCPKVHLSVDELEL